MHQYQIDDKVKNNFLIIAVLLAILLTYIFSLIIQYFQLNVPWWFETPSIFGSFGAIYWVYENYLWKTKLVQSINWLRTPNIAGNWKAEVRSSHDGFDNVYLGRAVVRQTAFKISVAIETDTSTSQSTLASLMQIDKINEYEIFYNYVNYPKADSLNTMSIHLGTVRMTISDDMKTLDGEYYTGRNRGNFGRITFTR